MQPKLTMGYGKKLAASLVILASAVFAFANDGQAAEVAMDRNEFVTLLANVKILKEQLAGAEQQIILHKKLDSDQKRLIVLHKGRIDELEQYIASTDKLTAEFKTTMEKTELVLDEAARNLAYEKRLSRYKTYAIVGGVILWLMW